MNKFDSDLLMSVPMATRQCVRKPHLETSVK